MKTLLSYLGLAGLAALLLFVVGLLLWKGTSEPLERWATLQSPALPATVKTKHSEWGGRAYGRLYYVDVLVEGATSTSTRARVEVSEDEYAALQRGQRVEVKTNPATGQRLLATSGWWTSNHLWWLLGGLFLLGYFIKRALDILRGQTVTDPAAPAESSKSA